MANIPLKSIQFPGLDDTYTVPSNAGELPYNKSATYPADTVGKALQNIGDSSAPAIIETATGSIASFDDGADNVPVKDLVAEIVPLQSGSGDPSPDNVRPITGWTECNVVVSPTEDAQDGETHTISFASAGTVYGGRLDVTSGVLTVDREFFTLNGEETWADYGGYPGVVYASNIFPHVPKYLGLNNAGISNMLVCTTNVLSDTNKGRFATSTAGVKRNIYIRLPEGIADASAWGTYLASHTLQLCYILDTPQTYQLTPTEVKTLLKNNNIWADTGDVTVEYVADTKTFIENLVNA